MTAFNLTEDQQLFKSTIDRLFAEHYGFEERTRHAAGLPGWNNEVWEQLAQLGLLGLPFPEEYGGMDFGIDEVALIMDAVGRHLALEPFFANVVMAGPLIAKLGTQAQKADLLAPLIEGRRLLALAFEGARDKPELEVVPAPDGWRISGQKSIVIGGDCAETLIVSAFVDGEIQLFLVPADASGVTVSRCRLLGGGGAADIAFSGVIVDRDAQLGGLATRELEDVLASATALLCVEAVGAMTALQDLTVEYLKTRRQFGAALGSFQVLQHRAVDMLVMLEQARSMAVLALEAARNDDREWRSTALRAAKIQIGRSSRFIGQQAIQLHGGIGMTDEYQASHYFRRLTAIEMLFGAADEHLVELAASGGLIGHWSDHDPSMNSKRENVDA